jgi:hypothetical protein
MKLISFLNQGQATYGAVLGDDVLDLGPILGSQAADLKTLIAKGLLGEAAQAAKNHPPTLKFAALTLLPVIPNPNKIVCVGLNYGEHVRETGREVTEKPALFLRLSESQVGHGQDIVRPPRVAFKLDYEGEIAVIIGKGGRRISEADSMEPYRGLQLLQRWQRARLAGQHLSMDGGQELLPHWRFWPLDGHRRRHCPRPEDDADHPLERGGVAARDHRHDDPQHPAPNCLHLHLHPTGTW